MPNDIAEPFVHHRPGRAPARSWRLPFLASFVFHALLAVGLWQWLSGIAMPECREPTREQSFPEEDFGRDVATLDVDVPLPPSLRPKPVIPTVEAGPAPAIGPAHEVAPAVVNETAPPRAAETVAQPGNPGGTGAAGQPTTTFFDVPAHGQSVAYVIDRSASMGPNGRLALARRELRASLERLPPSAHFQVVAYNRHVETLGKELLPATAANRQAALRFVEDLAAEGGTDHAPALRQALRFEAEVIYFLTDADDLQPQMVRSLTALNQGHCAIHAIELTTVNRDKLTMPLHVLARENRGAYRAVGVE